jgi:hypothetical protein
MKPQLALAFVVATAPAAFAQTATVPTDGSQTVTAATSSKPSAAIPMEAPATPYSAPAQAIPTQPEATAQPAAATTQPADEEFKPFKPYPGTEVTLHTRNVPVDPDAGIVTEVLHKPGELPMGTPLRARLRVTIDTQSTQPDTPFSAMLSEDVREGDRVLLPVGSVIEGTVTQARGGRRFRGTALIHLQAQRIVLPDGTSLPMQAQVIDTDQFAETRIDSEGNIVRKDHAGATLAAISLGTGSGAAAGAVFGGGFGALVGAGIGAGISTAVWLKADRQARLPADTLVIFGLTANMDLKTPRPDFVINPPAKPADTTVSSAPQSPAPTAPAYVPEQAFVPTN